MSNLNIRQLPEGLLQRIKVQAAIHGETIRQYVIDAVRRAVEGDEQDDIVTKMGKKP